MRPDRAAPAMGGHSGARHSWVAFGCRTDSRFSNRRARGSYHALANCQVPRAELQKSLWYLPPPRKPPFWSRTPLTDHLGFIWYCTCTAEYCVVVTSDENVTYSLLVTRCRTVSRAPCC